MSSLEQTVQLGDTRFGVPGDMEVLHKPYGFYEFLGVEKTADINEIKTVYKQLAFKFHPDNQDTGDEKLFKQLEQIKEILLDDGKKLGAEHGQKAHYDTVSQLDDYFDTYLENNGERSKKLSEILLIHMQIKRKNAESESKLEEEIEGFKELKSELTAEDTTDARKEEIAKELLKRIAETRDIDPEKINENNRERIEKMSEEMNRKKNEAETLFQTRRERDKLSSKIIDIYHITEGKVTFGTNHQQLIIGYLNHELKEHFLELVIGKDNYLSGFRQVHYKADEKVAVQIDDPHLTGIIDVLTGTVSVNYESSSYAGIIKVKAPKVTIIQGFTKDGDLYIPTRFATGNWQKQKPALEIKVLDGEVSLSLRNPEISHLYDYGGYGALDKILYNNNNQIITKKNYY